MNQNSTSVAESRTKTETNINPKAYISICAFMIKDLHLQNEELLAYAYIHGLNINGYDCEISKKTASLLFFLQCTEEKLAQVLDTLFSKKVIDIQCSKVFKEELMFVRCRYFAEDFQ